MLKACIPDQIDSLEERSNYIS